MNVYESSLDFRNFFAVLREEVENSSSFAVALIDLDHFHKIDDGLTLDQRLEGVYRVLQEQLPKVQYLGRDEFAAIGKDMRGEDLLIALVNVKNRLLQETKVDFTAGIAEYPKNTNDLYELIRNLEESVYHAKQEGRGRVSLGHEPKMKMKTNYYTLTQLNRISKLSQALGRTEASLLREALDELLRKYA